MNPCKDGSMEKYRNIGERERDKKKQINLQILKKSRVCNDKQARLLPYILYTYI